MNRKLLTIIVYALLISSLLGGFLFTPSNVEAKKIDRKKVSTKLDSGFNYDYFWGKFWNDTASWKTTPKNEDLTVITEYPAEDTCKVTLDLRASQKATYKITFKIDMELGSWEIIDDTSILLKYGNYKILFDFSDVEDMKLQHSKSTKGKQFVFHIQKEMEKNERLYVDPTLIMSGEDVGLGFQDHVWYYDGYWYVFYRDSTYFRYNATDDSFATSISGTLSSAVGAPASTSMCSVWFNGTHFHVGFVSQNEDKLTWDSFKVNANHSLSAAGTGSVCYGGTGTDSAPYVVTDSSGYARLLRQDTESGSHKPAIQIHNNTKNDGDWAAGTVYWLEDGTCHGYGQLLDVENRDLYAIWTHGASTSNLTARYYNYTANLWGAEQQVTNELVSGGENFDSIELNGVIYLVFRHVTDDYAYLVSSTVGSGSWSTHTQISHQPILGNPQISKHEVNDEFWITYLDSENRVWKVRWNAENGWYTPQIAHVLDQTVTEINMPYEIPDGEEFRVGFLFTGTSLYYAELNLGPVSFYFSISDMEGCGNWVFAEEKYYTFNATYVYEEEDGWEDFSQVAVAWNDGFHWMNVTYTASSDVLEITAGEDYFNLERISVSSISDDGLAVIFGVYLEEPVLDYRDVDVYMWAETTVDTLSVITTATDTIETGSTTTTTTYVTTETETLTSTSTTDTTSTLCETSSSTYSTTVTSESTSGTSTTTHTTTSSSLTTITTTSTSYTTVSTDITTTTESIDTTSSLTSTSTSLTSSTSGTTTYADTTSTHTYSIVVVTEYGWALVGSDYFNIYNTGGFSDILTSGTTQHITGGTLWDWRVGEDAGTSWVMVNQTWKYFQSVRWYTGLFGLGTYSGWPWDSGKEKGYAEYGIMFCDPDDVWVKGLNARINITEGRIGGWWVTATNKMELTVEWYNNNTHIMDEPIYGFGEVTPEYNITRYVVDLWVSTEEHSTRLGGHINVVYFGESEAYFSALKNGSRYMTQCDQYIYDHNGDVISANDVKMWKIYYRLFELDTVTDNYWITSDTQMNILKNEEQSGVDHPTFLEPRTFEDERSWGLFEPIRQGLLAVANIIIGGLTMAFNITVGFLDTVAGIFGLPNLFSNFFGYITALFIFVGQGMANMVTMLTQMYEFFAGPITSMLTFIGQSLTAIVTMFTTMANIVSGTYDWSTNIWDTFNLGSFVILFVYFAVPLYLLGKLARGGIGEVWDSVYHAFNVLIFFVNLFIRVIVFVVNLIVSIVQSLTAAKPT